MVTREGYHRLKGTWQPSAAEQRVLEEVAAGRTNAEIAVRLGLSPETVKSHVARMLGETGCEDREALARWWDRGQARRSLVIPFLGLALRGAATLAAIALGVLLLVAGGGAIARVAPSLLRQARPVSVALPPDLPAPPLPTPRPRHPVDFLWQQVGMTLPGSIALDPAGNVYVAVVDRHTIQKYDPNGSLLAVWGGLGSSDGQFDFSTATGSGRNSGLDADAAGLVYVVDGTGRVQVFDGAGTFLRAWPTSKGRGFGQIDGPTALALDGAGHVYIADGRADTVLKFATDGTPLARWDRSGTGPGEFRGPAGLAIDAEGNVYVADRMNHRIQKFDPSGRFLLAWGVSGSGDGEFTRPEGLAVDAAGNVYVADNYNHRVQKFDPSGRYLTQGGGPGRGDGEFTYTGDLAVDAQGNLYVLDVLGGRLQKMRLR